ncbi:MAG: MFS transporter [Aliidongia sp.]
MTHTQAVPSWRDVAATGQLAKFTLLCLGVWLHAADSLLVATVMPAAVQEIGGVAFINWALALYHLGSILAAVVTGSITGRIGLRAGLALAAMLYAAGCAASAVAPAIGPMLVGRLMQGLGGGGMMALVYVAIHEIFPERFWPRLLVVVSTIWGASALCGPLIGGLFAEAGLWRWAFWAFAGQAVIVVAAAAFLPSRRSGPGGGWAALPLSLLVLGTVGIAAAGAVTAHGAVVAALLGLAGLGLLYAFALLDARHDRHLLPVDALDLRRPVGNGLLMVLALAASTTPFGTYGPLLLGLLFGVGPLTAGYMVALESIAWTWASIATAGVMGRAERGVDPLRRRADRGRRRRLCRRHARRIARGRGRLSDRPGRRVWHGLGLYGQADRRCGAGGGAGPGRRFGFYGPAHWLCRGRFGQRHRRECRGTRRRHRACGGA